MRLERIAKIRDHRVFREFEWPPDLPDFARYNLVYGWNGSGKSTLARLFRHLEQGTPVVEGMVAFQLEGGSTLSSQNISHENTLPVRVFDRRFVERTVDSFDTGQVAPIYFLGEATIKQQKQVEELHEKLAKSKEAVSKAKSAKDAADKRLDDFCIEKAKLIKESLLGSSAHANYNKRDFKQAMTRLKAKSPAPAKLNASEKEKRRKQKELSAKATIDSVPSTTADQTELQDRVSQLLAKSVASQILEELARDPDLGVWVQNGLSLHQGDRFTNTCRFCGNELRKDRRGALEAHFNDAFGAFQEELDTMRKVIDRHIESLDKLVLPDLARFYDHLAEDAQESIAEAHAARRHVEIGLEQLSNAVELKKAKLFEVVQLDNVGNETHEDEDSEQADYTMRLQNAIESVNALIQQHNDATGNLKREVKQACDALEQDYALEALHRYDELTKVATEKRAEFEEAERRPSELAAQIEDIESQIIEHRRPAEELNHELASYLGRDELRFQIEDGAAGYSLMRSGQRASDLSEGERTAIAFLYFLKSLKDRGFDARSGIVVIDDPVSSLDSNALFSAFGYMKDRTKESHQLFILTHSFPFFRQVKNWFHHLPKQRSPNLEKRQGRFYMLVAQGTREDRNASISALDPLLEQYESEYHYLFKQVFDAACKSDKQAGLAQHYGVPNVARRLLETFLAYRFPNVSGDLIRRLERVEFDATKKTRILRLLNSYSHSVGISEPEHDPTVLAESQEVMKLTLEMLEHVDPSHYEGMKALVTAAQTETELE